MFEEIIRKIEANKKKGTNYIYYGDDVPLKILNNIKKAGYHYTYILSDYGGSDILFW